MRDNKRWCKLIRFSHGSSTASQHLTRRCREIVDGTPQNQCHRVLPLHLGKQNISVVAEAPSIPQEASPLKESGLKNGTSFHRWNFQLQQKTSPHSKLRLCCGNRHAHQTATQRGFLIFGQSRYRTTSSQLESFVADCRWVNGSDALSIAPLARG